MHGLGRVYQLLCASYKGTTYLSNVDVTYSVFDSVVVNNLLEVVVTGSWECRLERMDITTADSVKNDALLLFEKCFGGSVESDIARSVVKCKINSKGCV